jgi:hypothetical protein
VAAGIAAFALLASACSSPSTPGGDTSAVALQTPNAPVEGCTYTVNGQIESVFPTGKDPHFSSFSPDPSAEAALNSIKSKGGKGAVDTFTFPNGTKLRSGPSSSAPVVGTVPGTDQLELYDPIVWTDSAGSDWLATFIACGGKNLYWVGLNDLQQTNSASAKMIQSQLAELRKARPYTQAATASLLPIVLESSGQVGWKDKAITFAVGRAELASTLG